MAYLNFSMRSQDGNIVIGNQIYNFDIQMNAIFYKLFPWQFRQLLQLRKSYFPF